MYADYECQTCKSVELVEKSTPRGEAFASLLERNCEKCKSVTLWKRQYSRPVVSIGEGFDKELGIYSPAPLSPMNKIEHFNKGLGRTAGVETAYDISPE